MRNIQQRLATFLDTTTQRASMRSSIRGCSFLSQLHQVLHSLSLLASSTAAIYMSCQTVVLRISFIANIFTDHARDNWLKSEQEGKFHPHNFIESAASCAGCDILKFRIYIPVLGLGKKNHLNKSDSCLSVCLPLFVSSVLQSVLPPLFISQILSVHARLPISLFV